MIINLTALLDDGTPPRPGVQTDPRRTLSIPQGADVAIAVTVVRPDGMAVDLSGSGTELLLTIKKHAWQDPPRIVKRATLAGGAGTFTIEPGDTKRLDAGQYEYDVWLTLDGDRNAVIPLSMLILTQSVAAIPSEPPPPILYLVENDTEPLVLDFSGTNITGWLIEVHLAYTPTPLVKSAVITDPTGGLAEVAWLPGDLLVGRWAGEVQVTKPGPVVQTTDVFIADIRAEIA